MSAYQVLVAEDHPVNQKVAGLLLNALKLNYKVVNNGQQAVAAVKQDQVGVILMDIMMPVMDGFEAAHEIRRFEFARYKNTPIIACTSMDEDVIREQCILSGMNDYISKPMDRRLLRTKLEYWLGTEIQEITQAEDAAKSTEPLDRAYLNVLYGIDQLDDILDLYLMVTEALLGQLNASIQKREPMEVKRIAHEIKGGSYSVSAKEMADLSRELERAGEQEAWTDAMKIYAALFLSFGKVRSFINYKNQESAIS